MKRGFEPQQKGRRKYAGFAKSKILQGGASKPIGTAKNKNTRLGVFLIGFPILSRVRKLGGKNYARFTHLRTFKKKRLEI
ncbi:MAG: hypothetical protein K5912_01585 [Alphaproteobacteria bacterium]|nr:hypothetical protein [Alphaproteobacteria bacterium]